MSDMPPPSGPPAGKPADAPAPEPEKPAIIHVPPPPPRKPWWRTDVGMGALVAGSLLLLAIIIGAARGDSTPSGSDTREKRTIEKQSESFAEARDEREERDEKAEPTKGETPKPKPKPKPVDPVASMQADVMKNLRDEVGKESATSVTCDTETAPGVIWCEAIYQGDEKWDGDEEEYAREMGGVFHELFRDTEVVDITVHAQTTTMDELGKETPNDDALVVNMTRSGWESIDWDNLQITDPTNMKLAAESYLWRLTLDM